MLAFTSVLRRGALHLQKLTRLNARAQSGGTGDTYRDKVNKFNEHLAGLSEHHDIPRVGPG